MISITLIVVGALVISVVAFLSQPNFGKAPAGARLERIKKSPHYRNGRFQNLSPTQQLTSDKPSIVTFYKFIFKKVARLAPQAPLPFIKTDLKKLIKEADALVWFGHSSYLLQLDGKRILVDPVFDKASPVSFLNKAFKGTEVYQPDEIPDIDYLIITHDHWDHLDYKTVKNIAKRSGKIICGLGVGAHLEHWGIDTAKVIEMDWNEAASLEDGFAIHCLPARHFSGRGLKRDQSLWASYLLQTPTQKIYIGGDSGYDKHFANIGKNFPDIDLAILENGQYNEDWRYIHMLPEDLRRAAKDIQAKKILTVHHSKFALARHTWDEPLKNALSLAEKDSLNVLIPMMGEVVRLNDSVHAINKWWEGID